MKISLSHEIERQGQACPKCWSDQTTGAQENYDKPGEETFTCAKCGKQYPRKVGEIADSNKRRSTAGKKINKQRLPPG